MNGDVNGATPVATKERKPRDPMTVAWLTLILCLVVLGVCLYLTASLQSKVDAVNATAYGAREKSNEVKVEVDNLAKRTYITWNAQKLCRPLNETLTLCTYVSLEKTSPKSEICPEGYRYDAVNNRCVK